MPDTSTHLLLKRPRAFIENMVLYAKLSFPSVLMDADHITTGCDSSLDQRLALPGGTTWHPSGTCAVGKVVDTRLGVRGVQRLWVVDASVLPVPLSAHIQAPLYTLAEHAAAIIGGRA